MPKSKPLPTCVTPKTPRKVSQIPIPLGAKARKKLEAPIKSEKANESLLKVKEPETQDFSAGDPPKQKNNSPKPLMPREKKPDKEESAVFTGSQDNFVRDPRKTSVKTKTKVRNSKEKPVKIDPPLELAEETPTRDLSLKPKENVQRKSCEEDKTTKNIDIEGLQPSAIEASVKTRKKGQVQKKVEPSSQISVLENDNDPKAKANLPNSKSVEPKAMSNVSKNTSDDSKPKAIVSGSEAVEPKEKVNTSKVTALRTKTKIPAPNCVEKNPLSTEFPRFKSRKLKAKVDPSPVAEQPIAFETIDIPESPLESQNVPQKSSTTDSKTKVKAELLPSADSLTKLSRTDKRQSHQNSTVTQKSKTLKTKTKSPKPQDEPERPSLSNNDISDPKLPEDIGQKGDQLDSKKDMMSKIDDYKSRSKAKKMKFIQELLDSLNDEVSDESLGDVVLEAEGSDTEDKAKESVEGQTENISGEDVMAKEENELIIEEKETKTDDASGVSDSSETEVESKKSSSEATDEDSETDANEEDETENETSSDNTDTEDENPESKKERDSNARPDSEHLESSSDSGTNADNESDDENNGSNEIDYDDEEALNTENDSSEDESTNSGEMMENAHIAQEIKMELAFEGRKEFENESDESSSESEESEPDLEEGEQENIEHEESDPKGVEFEGEEFQQGEFESEDVVPDLEKSDSEAGEIELEFELEEEESEIAEDEKDEPEESDNEPEVEEEIEERVNRFEESSYEPEEDHSQSRMDETGAVKDDFEGRQIVEQHLGENHFSDDDEKNGEDSWSDSKEESNTSVNEGAKNTIVQLSASFQQNSYDDLIQEASQDNLFEIQEESIDESSEDQQEEEELGSTITSDEYESLDFAISDNFDNHDHKSKLDETYFIDETELEIIPEALEPPNETRDQTGASLDSKIAPLISDVGNVESSDQLPDKAIQKVPEGKPINQMHSIDERKSPALELQDDLNLEEENDNVPIEPKIQGPKVRPKHSEFHNDKSKKNTNKGFKNFPWPSEIDGKIEVVVPIIQRKHDMKPEARSLEKRKKIQKPNVTQNMREEHFEERIKIHQ
ncbi:hypothetical protein TCAL_15630 [Tigriopus californicus]|uniref:Uncharacterized protein n=1 Tax=Tigriopus californicus TaxID=6832 RepID=A0A553PAJ4_TIGCA|nr:hypothetical protein TCAL_15630 [Tigriopus californicus]